MGWLLGLTLSLRRSPRRGFKTSRSAQPLHPESVASRIGGPQPCLYPACVSSAPMGIWDALLALWQLLVLVGRFLNWLAGLG